MLGYRESEGRMYGVSVEGVGKCVKVWEVWGIVGGGMKK